QWRRAEEHFLASEEQRRRAEALWAEAEDQRQRAEAKSREAEEAFRLAHQAVDDFYTKISEQQLASVPGLQPLRKQGLEAALRYYQGFLRLRGGDPAARAEVAAAHVRVALLTSAVGSKEQALPEYERALALYQELARDAPDNPRWPFCAAGCWNNLGVVRNALGRPAEAQRAIEQARDLLEPLARSLPGDRDVQD